ncbi:berberine bridge enzyme-like D-2 [Miscanthus floridulus]|uniref:berberine bridge enzyme-like D-2 n=1 Tax=Miscanthus floridulus TaxID=154761 RepID=UPI00345920E9
MLICNSSTGVSLCCMLHQVTPMSCSIAALLVLVSLFLSLHQSTSCCATGADDGAANSLSSCLISHGVTNFTLPTSPSYAAVLNSSISNLRFALPDVGKPAAVVLPASKRDLQGAVLCARNSSLAIRVRSGGHSYEGLSYTTENRVPFVVIDLANLNRVRVDAGSATAWAESGATLGELYYAVGRSSRSLAFSAGSCSTIGLGGIVSGGGFGLLSRKFGLAADNVLDAVLVDADGRALDRATMGRDVFWAIRGGGGGSWGVVYAWKLRLVPVPRNVTVFSLGRTGPVELVAGLIHRWQFVAPSLPDDFYLSVYLPTGGVGSSSSSSDGNVSVSFSGQVLGPKHRALSALRQSFPELGLTKSELAETSWLDATAQFAGLDTAADLSNRLLGRSKQYSKGKSDYVRSPISRRAMAGIVRYLSTGPPRQGQGQGAGYVILDPYGGAMARIGSSDTPCPHRAGTLYGVQYQVYWDDDDHDLGGREAAGESCVGWLRSLYAFMAPHVSKDPRAAYVNYLDLDLGTNNWTASVGGSSEAAVARARSSWGVSYFGDNFNRLVRAKTAVDPGNVFNNAQSIPPL